MLTAYFDASGHQSGDRPVVVVGITAPNKKWERFEQHWSELLTSYQIPYLHMRDFAPSNPPYDVLRGDEAKRREILSAVCRAIKPLNKIVAYHVSPAVFREADKRFVLGPFWTGAYTLAATFCVDRTRRWAASRYPRTPVRFFVEQGDEGQGRFGHLMRDVGIEVTLMSKQDTQTGNWFAPFQAADFIAYEIARELAEADAPVRKQYTRWPMLEIHRTLPYELRELPLKGIIAMAENYPVVFPRRTD